MSPSSGTVLAGTPIAVDFWSPRQCPTSVQLFFLTHMHADHILGLKPSWNDPIYCTPVTKKLLLVKFQASPSLIYIFVIYEYCIMKWPAGMIIADT